MAQRDTTPQALRRPTRDPETPKEALEMAQRVISRLEQRVADLESRVRILEQGGDPT